MDIFSNRELAIGFWMLIALMFCLYSDSSRPHVKQLIKCFFNIYILTPIIGMGLYIAVVSYFLIEANFWNFNQYKNVTLWFICVGIYSMFQVVDVNKGSKYFRETLADLFKITTLFEFVITFYSFGLLFELIFVPFMTFIVLLMAVADMKKEHKIVSDMLGWLTAVIGGCIIINVCIQFVHKPETFFSEGTIYDFAVPLILTLAIFPYLFILMLYSEYGRLLTRLKMNLKNDDLVRYAVRRAMLLFNIRLVYFRRWDRHVIFHDVKTRQDIDASIKRIIFLMKRDRRNQPIPFDKGWPHYEARRFLKEYGLTTSYYDHLYYDEWGAFSEYLKLGEGFFCNKIKYYIDGNEESVKCLTLVLEINKLDSFQDALEKFKAIGDTLVKKAISENKALSINSEEIEGKEDGLYQTHTTEVEGRHIMIQKRKHANQESFELRLSFAVDKESFKYADTI